MKMKQISFFPLMMVLLWAAGTMAGPIEGTPRRGGTLINVTGSSPSNLTCGFEKSAHTNVVTESMYNGLVHPDAEGGALPLDDREEALGIEVRVDVDGPG